MFLARTFVFANLIVCATAAHGAGLSIMCRHCDSVSSPSECKVFERCPELCMTNVYEENGVRNFHYSCKTQHECEASSAEVLIGKRAHHPVHGKLVCTECCRSTNCDAHTCESFNPYFHTTTHAPDTTLRPHIHVTHPVYTHEHTTHTPTTHAPTEPTTHAQTTSIIPNNGCVDKETQALQCASLDQFNFCTNNASVAYAIAHERCPRHCGFCDPYAATAWPTDVPPATTTMTKTESTTIVHGPTPVVVVVTVTQAPDVTTTNSCVDHGDASLTCADIQKYGFCDPDSGAGYSFAQLRCPLTCGFCGKT